MLSLDSLLARREMADGGRLAVEVEDKSVKIRNVKVRVFLFFCECLRWLKVRCLQCWKDGVHLEVCSGVICHDRMFTAPQQPFPA